MGRDINRVTIDAAPIDLSVLGSEITFSTNNPAPGNPVVIQGIVHNDGSEDAEGALIQVYANDVQINGDILISNIPAGGQVVVEVTNTFASSQVAVIRISADPLDTIVELDESNNDATRLLVVGAPGIEARLVVDASVPGVVCPSNQLWIVGNAYYEIPFGATTNTYAVKGAEVTMQIESNAFYDGGHTDTNGAFRGLIVSPVAEGQYRLYVRVNDESLEGQEEITLTVSETACDDGILLPDLLLQSCGGLELATNYLTVGVTSSVDITVWNVGAGGCEFRFGFAL